MRLGMDTFSQFTDALPLSQTPSCQLVQKFSQWPRHTNNRTRGYLPPGLRGAGGKGSPRPDEDNRLLTRIVMRPGIRITQDSADPCRGMSTQEPVRSIKLKVRRDAAMGHFVTD